MTYEINLDRPFTESETQAQIHDAIIAVTDTSVSGMTSFSLLGIVNGQCFGAATAVLKAEGEDAPSSVEGAAVDVYNDLLAKMNDQAASARFFEDAGGEVPLDPVIALRQKLHLREVVMEALGAEAPLEETMAFLFRSSVEQLPPLNEEDCRKTAKRVGKDGDQYWAQRQADRVRQVQGIATRLQKQLETIKDQGRLLELTAEHGDTASEEDRVGFEYPSDTLELLQRAVQGAKKGVIGRSRGRTEHEINADLDLLEALETHF